MGLVLSDLHTLGQKYFYDAQYVSGTLLNTSRETSHSFYTQGPTVWLGRHTYPEAAHWVVYKGYAKNRYKSLPAGSLF